MPGPTRRAVLAGAAGAAAGAATPAVHTKELPRTGERIPALGLGIFHDVRRAARRTDGALA